MRKAYLIALATVAASLPLWGIALAAGNTAAEYQPLTGIYGITDVGKVSAGNQLSTMLGNVFNLLIGFSGLAAVVMISWGAVLYMFSESLTSKGEGRDKMQNAVIGLLLVLFTYTILYTINPDILELRLFVQKVVAPVSPDKSGGFDPAFQNKYDAATAPLSGLGLQYMKKKKDEACWNLAKEEVFAEIHASNCQAQKSSVTTAANKAGDSIHFLKSCEVSLLPAIPPADKPLCKK